VIDGIAWALGGKKFEPSQPHRDGSVLDPSLKVVLSNGLIVERKGKNADLKVTDPTGKKSGQQLLNSLIGELALNVPKFLESSDKEKAEILLKIIGVEKELKQLEQEEQRLYQERLYTGRDAEQKAKYADELPFYPGVPDVPVSAAELIQQQQDILVRNAEKKRWKDQLSNLKETKQMKETKLIDLEESLAKVRSELKDLDLRIAAGEKACDDWEEESTAEIEENLEQIEVVNAKIRSNLNKEKAAADADLLKEKYKQLTNEIEQLREERMSLLQSANLPLPELSVEDGKLTYKNKAWDCMSGSDQLKVATAIVRKLNPECGFVLLDKLEQMDLETLNEFGEWLEKEGLQAIATRVSTGGECSIIISDGEVQNFVANVPQYQWTGGGF
jgi:hypothetical protein